MKGDDDKYLSIEGLRPDQVRQLTIIRDNMLGWRFVGCAIDVDSDHLWNRGSLVRALGEAQLFKSAAKAELEIERRIRGGDDDDRMLTVVGVYRKGDEWEPGPAVPPLTLTKP